MIRLLECLGRRRRGWNIVRALDRALPGHFGLNVVHAMEAREIVRGWLAASEGRIFRF